MLFAVILTFDNWPHNDDDQWDDVEWKPKRQTCPVVAQGAHTHAWVADCGGGGNGIQKTKRK